MIKLPIKLTLAHFNQLPQTIQLAQNEPQTMTELTEIQGSTLYKSYLPLDCPIFYKAEFVKVYLLIKLNSLCSAQCVINRKLLGQLAKVYNGCNLNDIVVSATEGEIMSQIIGKIEGKPYLSREELSNIVEGNGLLAASSILLLRRSAMFLKKQEVVFCMSFLSLGGRQNAFIPIVHKQKYHAGQIHFAHKISTMFHLKKKLIKEQIKVQDPYSMRCSPQVHGVAYDCLEELKNTVQSLINRPHYKEITLKGKKIPNLLQESDNFSLKMDYLICCLQEIGAMAFLRTERILNTYLGKNKLKDHPQYTSLLSMLAAAQPKASKNKILSQMTNFDTGSLDSYNKDIFYNSGSFYGKIQQLFSNLYFIMVIQVMSSIEALKDAFSGNLKDIQFENFEMNGHFIYLRESVSPWDKNQSYKKIKQQWKI